MPDSLLELEKRRSEILEQMAALGDFRRGSISATGGRCGTPGCHCHNPTIRVTDRTFGSLTKFGARLLRRACPPRQLSGKSSARLPHFGVIKS